ncbi:MAG: hypothetical protein ACKO7W_17195 [Elainella sp.]
MPSSTPKQVAPEAEAPDCAASSAPKSPFQPDAGAVSQSPPNPAAPDSANAAIDHSTDSLPEQANQAKQAETPAPEAPNPARRIQQLEQALDQALSYIEELRLQVQNQHLLEIQLADTEDYASVQQQAILRLKGQLAEQQQALEAQILETQQRDQAIQELLATIESMAQAQQREVERLRSRLVQDQRDVQSHRSRLGKHLQDLQSGLESRQRRIAELEAETVAARLLSARLQNQLEGAQQQIRELSARLSSYHTHLAQIETRLEQAQNESGHRLNQPGFARSELLHGELLHGELLHHSHPTEPIPAFAPTASAQRWQQQEMGAERDWLQTRVSDLEQQVAELQEQVLRQAQQKTEDETAVQYWKDRYWVGQAQLGHLKDLAQQVATADLPPALQEVLLAIQLLPSDDPFEQTDFTSSQPGAEPSNLLDPSPPRLTTVELPEFLVRRRPAPESCAAKTS